MTRREYILEVIKLRKNPSAEHQKLKIRLEKEGRLGPGWTEYDVIEFSGVNHIVDFSNLESNEVILLGDHNILSNNYTITTYSVDMTKEQSEVLFSQGGYKQSEEAKTLERTALEDNPTKLSNNTTIDKFRNTDIVEFQSSREELNDLISNTPGWLLHSGITVIGIVLTMILILSHLISYPDKISGSGYISTEQAPLELKLHHGGRIADIYQEHGSPIQKGDLLIYLDNPANKLDVASALRLMQRQDYERLQIGKTDLVLGPMQNHFAQFLTILREYHHVRAQTTVVEQTATLESEIQNIDRLNSSIAKEEEHYRVEQKMAEKEFNRAKVMIDQGLIAEQEYEQTEAQYNQFLRQLEQTDKSRIQNSIRQDQLNLEQNKIQAQRSQQLQDYRFRLNEISIQFMAAYEQWYEDYHLIAEASGQLDWASRYAEGLVIDGGSLIGYILPEAEQSKVLVTSLGPQGYARLDSTTRVIVKSHAHPYKEYGVLQSTISHMASIPYRDPEGQAIYQLYIPMDSTMVTSYGKVITYRPNMTADVELITEARSVLSRIFEQFTDLINNKPSEL